MNEKCKTKVEVMRKNKWFCSRCGRDLLQYGIDETIDHIIPKSKGGQNDVDNYLPLCYDCNRDKGNKIVYPSFYYYYLNSDNPTIIKSNEEVKSYLLDNITKSQIEDLPLLFDELLFSAKFARDDIKVVLGWNDRHKSHYFCEKVNCRLEQFKLNGKINWSELHVGEPIYILYKSTGDIESVFNCTLRDNQICVNILYYANPRLVFYCIKAFVVRFKLIYKTVNINRLSIYGRHGFLQSLQDVDIRSYMEACDELNSCTILLDLMIDKEV